MAYRYPLRLADVPYQGNTANVETQPQVVDSAYMTAMDEFAGWVHSQYPSTYLEVGNFAADPNLLSGFPITDTYWIAGASTTDVTNFDTEAETPNITQSSTSYSSIRQTFPGSSFTPSDPDYLTYPLFLYDTVGNGEDADMQLRAMSASDFYDTFVAPVVAANTIQQGSQTPESAGSYFLSTATAVANATRVSATPVYADTIADLAAYTASGIGETLYQPTVVNNYYLYVYSPALSNYAISDNLPLHFDAATETIREYTPAEWASVLGPWLQYYLVYGSSTRMEYNINGSGTTQGTTMIDTRRDPDGTAGDGGNYQQRYVNTNDYRTQEFPTGTPTVKSQHILKLNLVSTSESTILEGTTSAPETADVIVSDGGVTAGWQFAADGTVKDYDVDRASPFSTTGHLDWVNQSPPAGTYYIRGSYYTDSGATGNVTFSGQTLNTWNTLSSAGAQTWFITDNTVPSYGSRSYTFKFDIATDAAGSNIVSTGYYQSRWRGDNIALEGTSGSPETNGAPPLTTPSGIAVGWEFRTNGTVHDYTDGTYNQTGHNNWGTTTPGNTWYIRITNVSTPSANQSTGGYTSGTWYAISSNILFTVNDTNTFGSYGIRLFTWKVDIASDAAGSNIVATGYYQSRWEGGA